MDNLVVNTLKEVGALLEGHFLLSSGRHSNRYCQCAKLLQYPDKAEKVLKIVAEKLKNIDFDIVVGPAMGGIVVSYELARQLGKPGIFAERQDGEMTLRRGFEIKKGQKVVISEDVITTGKSSLEVAKVIEELGGDKSKIFVSGHSAGGYLTMMIGLNKEYLAAHKIDADSIAGLIPLSGQTITHFNIRDSYGMKDTQPLVDKFAPLFHVRNNAPPLLLITGDRELEMLGRYEENAYLARMMKITGHQQTKIIELQGYGHDMTYPAFPLLIKEVQQVLQFKK